MVLYVIHPFLRKNIVIIKDFQTTILRSINTSESTLLILPTGKGKTVIALLFSLRFLPANRILFLSPTNILVNQQFLFFKNTLLEKIPVEKIVCNDKDRVEKINNNTNTFIFSTPHIIFNDFRDGKIDLNSFDLIIFDEIHKGVGNYVYTKIGCNYNGIILGLTASPGNNKPKINKLLKIFKISNITSDFKNDKEELITLKPYYLNLNSKVLELNKKLKFLKYHFFKKLTYIDANISSSGKKYLLDYMKLKISPGFSIKKMSLFKYITLVIRCDYLSYLLSTQDISIFYEYILKDKKYSTLIKNVDFIKKFVDNYKNYKVIENPKVQEIIKIIKDVLIENIDSKIIIFVDLITTGLFLKKRLELIYNVIFLKGQGKKNTRKDQIENLEKFKENGTILITTSVGEEGLDIANSKCVIFYNPVTNEKRFIQRSGRTGRNEKGTVCILINNETAEPKNHELGLKNLKKINVFLKNL